MYRGRVTSFTGFLPVEVECWKHQSVFFTAIDKVWELKEITIRSNESNRISLFNLCFKITIYLKTAEYILLKNKGLA